MSVQSRRWMSRSGHSLGPPERGSRDAPPRGRRDARGELPDARATTVPKRYSTQVGALARRYVVENEKRT